MNDRRSDRKRAPRLRSYGLEENQPVLCWLESDEAESVARRRCAGDAWMDASDLVQGAWTRVAAQRTPIRVPQAAVAGRQHLTWAKLELIRERASERDRTAPLPDEQPGDGSLTSPSTHAALTEDVLVGTEALETQQHLHHLHVEIQRDLGAVRSERDAAARFTALATVVIASGAADHLHLVAPTGPLASGVTRACPNDLRTAVEVVQPTLARTGPQSDRDRQRISRLESSTRAHLAAAQRTLEQYDHELREAA